MFRNVILGVIDTTTPISNRIFRPQGDSARELKVSVDISLSLFLTEDTICLYSPSIAFILIVADQFLFTTNRSDKYLSARKKLEFAIKKKKDDNRECKKE